MKRIFALIVALLIATPAIACPNKILVPYNADVSIPIHLWLPDGTAHYTGSDFVAGDILVSQSTDGLAYGAQGNCTEASAACVTDEGTFQSIQLDAAELDTMVTEVSLHDAGGVWLDSCVTVETYGHASAKYPTADVNVISMADGVITAAKIADDAITAAKIAASAIGASEIAASAIGSSEAPNLDAAVSTVGSSSTRKY